MMSVKVRRASRAISADGAGHLNRLAGSQGDESHEQDDQQLQGADAEKVHGEVSNEVRRTGSARNR